MDDSHEVHQRANARQILRILAMGLDPITCKPLAENSILAEPEVIRALFMGIEALTDHDIPPPPDTRSPHLRRAGLPWSPEEDERLREEFSAGINIRIITDMHCRTQGAIASRLSHLQLVSSKEEVRRLLAWS